MLSVIVVKLNVYGSFIEYAFDYHYFSDETTTPNRQPEFTQLDIELSFTQPNDIMNLIENVFLQSWPKEFSAITAPFRRMTFNEAMDRYGSDKPDTRYSNFLVIKVASARPVD